MEQIAQLLLTKLIELAQMLGSVLARVEANEHNYTDADERISELEKMEGRILVLEASSTETKSGRQFSVSVAAVLISLIAVAFTVYFGFHAH